MLLARLEDLRWRFPEYWMLGLSASAWALLAVQRSMPMHHADVPGELWHWEVMVAAMMLPLQVRAVRLTAERSLWSRRDRSIALYIAGYAAVWALGGVLLACADAALHIRHRMDWTAGAAIGALVAGVWLISPWKTVAARLCHLTSPLSPLGWRADLDCFRYGSVSASRCAFNCWPLMIACWLSGHNLAIMFFAFGLGWADRHFPPHYKGQAAFLVLAGSAFGAYAFL